MDLNTIYNDPIFLAEKHVISTKRILSESCEGLTEDQIKIVEGIYNEFVPLIKQTIILEKTLTADEINQLFTNIEQGATAAGGNRTALGKGKDVVGKANEIINSVGRWLQNTTPVKAFDQKFEDLKAQIKEKLGGDDSKIVGGLQKLGELAKENPGKTAAIVGILTAIASVAGGPVGGAIAGQVLRGSVELLKGEKLSTAIGKGVKTAVLGYLTGALANKVGEWLSGLRAEVVPFDDGLSQINLAGSSQQSFGGMEWTRRFDFKGLTMLPDDAARAAELVKAVNAGEVGAFDEFYRFAKYLASDDYEQAMSGVTAIAKELAVQNDAAFQALEVARQGITAAAQGAVAAGGVAADGEKKQPAATPKEALIYNLRPLTESQIYLMFNKIESRNERMLSEGLLMEKDDPAAPKQGFMQKVMGKVGEFGKNLTTKVTASKLNSAWKKAGSPTDSDELADFLGKQGVNQEVVAGVFKGMRLPAPGTAGTEREIVNIKKELTQLGPETQKQMLAMMQKKLGMA